VVPMSADDPREEAARRTVLVVDDEILIRLMMADELRTAGFFVVEAANADEALRIMRRLTTIDLVMTDIQMPGSIDGLGFASTVRAEWPRVKVVVASAHIASSPPSDLADGFFTKPYEPSKVVMRVTELLGNRGQ